MVFQSALNSLNPVLRIRQFQDCAVANLGRPFDQARLHELMDMVELPHNALDMYPHQLSGGMRQRGWHRTGSVSRAKITHLRRTDNSA